MAAFAVSFAIGSLDSFIIIHFLHSVYHVNFQIIQKTGDYTCGQYSVYYFFGALKRTLHILFLHLSLDPYFFDSCFLDLLAGKGEIEPIQFFPFIRKAAEFLKDQSCQGAEREIFFQF